MINILITFGSIAVLLISGRLYEGIKKLISALCKCFLKFLDALGIRIFDRSHVLKTSKHFKLVFKDIKSVKKSNENIKLKPSLNITALIVLILSSTVLILNFIKEDIISQYIISLSWIKDTGISQANISAAITSAMIASVSFSLSKIINQIKATKKDRQIRKEMVIKSRAISLLNSKELLEEIKRKDAENFNRLVAENTSNSNNNNNSKENQEKTTYGRNF